MSDERAVDRLADIFERLMGTGGPARIRQARRERAVLLAEDALESLEQEGFTLSPPGEEIGYNEFRDLLARFLTNYPTEVFADSPDEGAVFVTALRAALEGS